MSTFERSSWCLLAILTVVASSMLVLTIKLVHRADVNKDESDEGQDRALLGDPEAEFESTKANRVEGVDEKNSTTERYEEPYKEK